VECREKQYENTMFNIIELIDSLKNPYEQPHKNGCGFVATKVMYLFSRMIVCDGIGGHRFVAY